MKRAKAPALALLFKLLQLEAGVYAQTGPIVWVAPSLQRVGFDDTAGNGTRARLYAARGEYESFQIVVRAPNAGLSNVHVSVSDLLGPGGRLIAKSHLRLFREHYVYLSSSSPDGRGSNRPLGRGWYADALAPFVDPDTGAPLSGSLKAVPFKVEPNKSQPIWVDLAVPRTAVAGEYTGTFTVTSDQGSANGVISVGVWNFTLPLQPALKSLFQIWRAGTLAAKQEVLRHRLMPSHVDPSEQRTLIDNLGLSTVDLGFFSGANIGNCRMSRASDKQLAEAAAKQQPDLAVYNYTADEVSNCRNLYSTIKEWGYKLHRANVKNLITMVPTPELFDDGSGSGRSAVDIWVVMPFQYDANVGAIKQALRKGDEVWSYNGLVVDSYSPKWQIDFSPINFRIQPGFINQSLGLTGLLYWQIDRWSSDPWNNVNNEGQFSVYNYAGEGMLVYPGQQVGLHGVIASMRLKWIRDGVDDFDYVALLKAAGQGAWALNVINSVAPDWTNWTRDPKALEAVRIQLGQKLDSLGRGTTASPPNARSSATVK